MQVDPNDRPSGPVITGLSRGGYKVEDKVFTGGLWITPEAVDNWHPPALDALTAAHLPAFNALSPTPEFLLLGTGATLQLPPRGFVQAMEAHGIGVEPMDSRAAARAWGMLRGEGRWIIGALYPLDH